MGAGHERYPPSGVWVWGLIGSGGVAMVVSMAVAPTMGGTAEAWLLGALGLFGGIYVIAKGWHLRAHVVELHDDDLRYGSRRVAYRDIRGLCRGWVHAGGERRSLLARSWIYEIETQDGSIQILGKFYPDDETMMRQISERSGVRMAER